MTETQRIEKLARLMRSAHCMLDILAGRVERGEREQVMEMCQALRNAYTDAFEVCAEMEKK